MSTKSSILVLGGDGYLGWPTAMRFSSLGYNVVVADNYSRRKSVESLGSSPLFNVPDLSARCKLWKNVSGKDIDYRICDLSDPDQMRSLFTDNPYGSFDTVIHLAEQPSAPYSQKDFKHADFTILNNIRVTNNLIWAIKDFSPHTHIVKLGTMGEYGTPNIDIEEGWIDITHNNRQDRFLFPRQAGSVYHTTKIMDTDLLWFAVRTWGLLVTDLMQGPVYGVETEESRLHPELKTFLNYDEYFGTVLNRFVCQAVTNYPLTIYGSGTQTRGYLNIQDTLQCIVAAATHPPIPGKMNIYNQIVETFSVLDIAERVAKSAAEIGLDVKIEHLPNPRVEAEDHYYNPTYQALKEIGLKPTYLTDHFIVDYLKLALSYADNIKTSTFYNGLTWK